MKRTRRILRRRIACRKRAVATPLLATGFTLVEMLVAVALTLLIMTLFAQIFQIAAGTMTVQRGIAENDQRARMLMTTLRGDLDKRTFREVRPFKSGEDTRLPAANIANRAGYFYYAENDPLDDTDDVLQFTTRVTINLQNGSDVPYAGRAFPITRRQINNLTQSGATADITVSGTFSASGAVWIFDHPDTDSNSYTTNDGRYSVSSVNTSGGNTTITINVPGGGFPESISTNGYFGGVVLSENDPDIDDGIAGNNAGQSQAAEISYYLRGGNLYRRVMLIREDGDEINAEPQWANGSSALWGGSNSNYVPSAGNPSFWGLYDYSSFHYRGYYDGSNLQGQGVRFLSAKTALNNGADAPEIRFDSTASGRIPLSLGMPNFRFGHQVYSGFPAEFITNPGPTQVFFGRFNLQESSHSGFYYPGTQTINDSADPSQDVSPLSTSFVSGKPESNFGTTLGNLTAGLTGSQFGIVDQFSNQAFRRGEDILLSNVLSFDVKAYDPGSFKFVDLGDAVEANTTYGYFLPGLVQNLAYSPNGTAASGVKRLRYDTWHPRANVGGDGDPPFFNTLTAVQIQINYRDVSTGTIRQTTIVQSLVDRN